jgi:hypothetical protein
VVLAGCGTRLSDDRFEDSAEPTPTPSASASAEPIVIGNITSRSNPFDARAFAGPYYGISALVDDVNRRGGVNGRPLVLRTCDDMGSADRNVTCVHQMLRDGVFALVSNAVLDYAGAGIVNDAGLPDIGGQPVDLAYSRYPHLWDIGGTSYPRNGRIGFDGVLHNGTEVYRFFRVTYPEEPRTAAVVFYNQSASERYGRAIAAGLRREGFRVMTAQVNFALPDYDSVAVHMRHEGVRFVFDAIDRAGNQRLCEAIDDNRVQLVAKVTTTQSWEASIRSDYADSPYCRNVIFATGTSANYDDDALAPVARFRAAMARLGWDRPQTMSQWALEGWAGGRWFVDAATSCGADLTRECLEDFLARPSGYDAGGLLVRRDFLVGDGSLTEHRSCLNVARWQDTARGGAGGWVTQVPDMTRNCFLVPSVPYRP